MLFGRARSKVLTLISYFYLTRAGVRIRCKGGWHNGCRCFSCLLNAKSRYARPGPQARYSGQFSGGGKQWSPAVAQSYGRRSSGRKPYKRRWKSYGGRGGGISRGKGRYTQRRSGGSGARGRVQYRQTRYDAGRVGKATYPRFNEDRYHARSAGRQFASYLDRARGDRSQWSPYERTWNDYVVGRVGERLGDAIYGAGSDQSWTEYGKQSLRGLGEVLGLGAATIGGALATGGGALFGAGSLLE